MLSIYWQKEDERMPKIICPICGNIHEYVPFKCECGYEEVSLVPKDYDNEQELLFAIYKFSKAIFNHQIKWKQSKFDYYDYDDKVGILEIFEGNSVAYVDHYVDGKKVESTAGVLAFKWNVKSLIINVDILDHELLDESGVRMLFIGDRVKEISGFINLGLKYLEVDKNNPYFTAKNNVLFNKDMTRLIFYCNMKPDVEYKIPDTVKVVDSWAFLAVSKSCNNLKKIYCSKNVRFEDPRSTPSPYNFIKIIYE